METVGSAWDLTFWREIWREICNLACNLAQDLQFGVEQENSKRNNGMEDPLGTLGAGPLRFQGNPQEQQHPEKRSSGLRKRVFVGNSFEK